MNHFLRSSASIALFTFCFLFTLNTFSQNIFSGEGVNIVGQINGYSQPSNLSADYRVLNYRKISTTVANPIDGRGQWSTTINVQNSGGNVTPLNMTGGSGAGVLFTSGPSSNQYANKWAFSGVGQATINGVNNAVFAGSSDMGINMSTSGYYTFVFQDNNYTNSAYFVGYTSSSPIQLNHNAATQQLMADGTLRVEITCSAAPSPQERLYVRYSIGSNDFTTSTGIVQATGAGLTRNAFIPASSGQTVYYYVFSSTRSLLSLVGDSEFNRTMSVLRFDDNTGNNYSYTFPNFISNPIIVTSSGGTSSAVYPNLTTSIGAFSAINSGVHTGTISIGIMADVSTENGAILLMASGSGSSNYSSIFISPNATVTVSGSSTSLISFNGADNVTIDGRIGGIGSTIDLIISNTSTAGSTLNLAGDATNNIIQYCTIKGVSTSTVSGVITILGGVTTGNDNNTIDHCSIQNGVTTPANGIYSLGSVSTTTIYNNGNHITNCSISNFFSTATSSSGIMLSAGNTDWTISGNSFFQTATRTAVTGGINSGIFITNTAGNNFIVSNNYIGGSAPLCGGTAWTISGSTTNRFRGISISVGTTLASQIYSNTISNISILSTSIATSQPGVFSGIYVAAGQVDVGVTGGNTIGASTGNGSIQVTVNTFSGSVSYGIVTAGITTLISNNTIGSITTLSGSALVSHGFVAISSQGASTITISNNLIGSTTTTNSINCASNSTSTTSQVLHGIEVLTGGVTVYITGNTIANLNNSYAFAMNTPALQTRGIYCVVGYVTMVDNTIYNISTSALTGATGLSAVLSGIVVSTTSPGTVLSQNTIYNLYVASPNSVGSIVGIYYSGAATGTNIIDRNFIHSFNTASTVQSSNLDGLYVNGGASTIQNNIIRLGITITGASLTTGYIIEGIIDLAGTNNYYHNSVYIGGSGVVGFGFNTYVFRSATFNTTRAFQNNIFYNARSNSTGTGAHYAIRVEAGAINPPGLTCNNNLIFTSGNGGLFGFFGIAAVPTFAAWQATTGLDLNSINGNPNFINPTGDGTNINLHLSPTGTPAEATGAAIASVTLDFDLETRSTLSPIDIGADAGNFTYADATPPIILFTQLPSITCSTSSQSVTATITDETGVPTTGSLVPRIYYKIGAAAYSSSPGTLVSGSGTSGNWIFSIPGASQGETVLYYIIAQDNVAIPNIISNPTAAFATDVNNVTTHPTAPSQYLINYTLSGIYNVGIGQTFTTLTAAINGYNTYCIAGPVTFLLTDSTYPSETFPISINANSSANSTNTLTIKPTLSNTAIEGSSTSGLIILNGADFVTIDGSVGLTTNSICPEISASRDLTITNTNTGFNSAVIWIQSSISSNSATNNTIKNINVYGNSTTTTFAGIGIGNSTISNTSFGLQNNNNRIENNSVSKVVFGIFSQGASGGNKNQSNVFSQNTLNNSAPNNIGQCGIYLGFENNVSVQANHVGEISAASDRIGMSIGFGTVVTTTTVSSNEVTNATINKNVIHNITAQGTNSALGIALGGASSGTSTISNNMVSGIYSNCTGTNYSAGIVVGSALGSATNVYHNSVSITGSMPSGTAGASVVSCLAIPGTAVLTVNIKNNIFSNTQIGNTSATTRFNCIALGFTSITGNYAGITSDYNNLYCTGAGPGTYQIGITGGLAGISRTTITDWNNETGEDINSLTVTPGFVSNSNLHSTSSNINNAGTIIAAVTNDIDCDARSGTTPDIGADEFNIAAYDIGVVAFDNGSFCPGSPINMATTVFNFGSQTITSFDITWNVNNGTNTTQSFTGYSIAPGTSAVVTLTGVTFPNITSQQSMYASTSLPNANVDANSANDEYVVSNINIPLSGVYTVGVSGQFTTIQSAFNRAALVGLCGPTEFHLLDPLYTVSSAVLIGQYTGVNSTNTLTLTPAPGVNSIIRGTASVPIVILLDGADHIIIEGNSLNNTTTLCPNVEAFRNLTISSVSNSTSGAVVWLQTATGSNGATNNTIQNCNILGANVAQTLFGIGCAGTSVATTSMGTGNNNNTYINNYISDVQFGLFTMGASAANKNSGTIIQQNNVTNSPNAKGGIWVGFDNGVVISGNTVSNIAINSSPFAFGINCGFMVSVLTNTTTGNEVTNATITNNKVGSVVNSGSFTALGIGVASASSGTTLIANNFVSGVACNGTFGGYGAGILLGGGAATTNVFHNSVSMQGTIPNGSAAQISTCLWVTASTPPILNIKNNIFSNTQAGGIGSGAAQKFATIGFFFTSTAGNYANLVSDYNDLYCAGPGPGTYMIGVSNGLISPNIATTISDWQTLTGRDANSLNVTPEFVSSSDLHCTSTSINNAGTPIVSITTDIDCETRNATTPDIGADEFSIGNCGIVIAGVISSSTDTICQGETITILGSGYSTPSATISYQWQSSVDGASGWTNVGQTNPATYTSAALNSSLYYRLVATCSLTSLSEYSNILFITVTPSTQYYADEDGDGYSSGLIISSCSPPVGYYTSGELIQTSGDCDDNFSEINPAADEWCNGVDDDCDGNIDDGLANVYYYQDFDQDGYRNPFVYILSCSQPDGYISGSAGIDCNDTNAGIYPGSIEVCANLMDDNCNGQIDENCVSGPINDQRYSALPVATNTYGICTGITGTLLNATISSEALSSCITGQDVWYYFTASSRAASVKCTSTVNNILLEVQTEDGVLVETENVQSIIGSEVLNTNALTPGNSYYVIIRNYNSAQGQGGSFNLCVQNIHASTCDIYASNPGATFNRCGTFKADYTAANQYIFHFGTSITYSTPLSLTAANTIISLQAVTGLTFSTNYSVTVDAVYTLQNGAGATEMLTVLGTAITNIYINPQLDIDLRAQDAMPNTKPIGAFVSTHQFLCNVLNYNWSFTEVTDADVPIALPIIVNSVTSTRYMRLISANIPGILQNKYYRVQIQPVFSTGPGLWYTNYQLLHITPSGGMVLEESNTALEETLMEKDMRGENFATIYPNPNNGQYCGLNVVNTVEGTTQVRIMNNVGQVVYTNQFATGEGIFNTAIVFEKELANGLYMVEITLADKSITTERMVVAD